LNPKDPDGDGNIKMRGVMQYDLGEVTMSIMLTAADLGIGNGRAGILNQTRAREVLDFPADWLCGWPSPSVISQHVVTTWDEPESSTP